MSVSGPTLLLSRLLSGFSLSGAYFVGPTVSKILRLVKILLLSEHNALTFVICNIWCERFILLHPVFKYIRYFYGT